MPVGSVRFRRRSDKLWLLGAFLLLALLLLNFWREAISEKLVPDARLNRNLERAQKQLQRGELSRADGNGARELFESVLATDPDQMLAREGLVAVRNAALARAGAELREHRLENASRDLELAAALSAPLPQLQPLRARLRALEEASVDVPALLARAAAPGVGDEEALALLDQVLALDAGNALALDGRQELFAAWLLRAEHELDAGQVERARARIERVLVEDPAHVDLPPLRARLGELAARQQRGESRELLQARADERAGRLDAAAATYARLAVDSDEARAGLARISQQRRQQAHAARAPLPAASRRELRRVPGLLAEAAQAMARDEFLTPPGASAWDKLRVAAAIAPNAPAVRAMQAEFVRRSADCFEQAMAAGRLNRAQSCLEAWQAQQPDGAGAQAARRRLAERWLAYADERIGASDWVAAEKALESARRWQPRHPQLRAAQTRLRRARGGAH